MMKCNLYQEENNRDEHIDIYYHQMRPVLKKVIDLVNEDERVIWGKTEDERVAVSLDDILYIESVDKKTFAYLETEVYETEGTLAECAERLYDYGFFRISKSHIVNIFQIQKLKPEVNMKVCAIFSNGEQIYINRSYKKSFHEYLVKMKGNANA